MSQPEYENKSIHQIHSGCVTSAFTAPNKHPNIRLRSSPRLSKIPTYSHARSIVDRLRSFCNFRPCQRPREQCAKASSPISYIPELSVRPTISTTVPVAATRSSYNPLHSLPANLHVGTFTPSTAIAPIAATASKPTFKQLPIPPPFAEAMGNVPSQTRSTPNIPTGLAKTALPSSATVHAVEALDTAMGSPTSTPSTSYWKTTTVTVPGTLIIEATSVTSVLEFSGLPSSTMEPTTVKPLLLFDGSPSSASTKKEVLKEPDSASTSTSSTTNDVSTTTEFLRTTTLSTSTTSASTSTTPTTPSTFMPTTHEPPSFTDSSSFTFRRCVHSDSPEEGTSDGCVLVVAPLTSTGGDDGGVPTLLSTPTLTSLSLPTLNSTSSSLEFAAAPSPTSNGTAAAAPLKDTSSTKSGSSWSAAKVIAPTVVISVLIAGLVLWWLIRRERNKNVERERQIEEKAQFFSQSYCDGLGERMMGVDEGKTKVIDGSTNGRIGGGEGSGSGSRDVRESGWVGGTGSDSASARDRAREEIMEKRREKQKESSGNLSVIEREMASARGEKAGGETESPVSSLTNSPNASRAGKGAEENASSNESLTALPNENWKVFRGSREIQPYQPSHRKEEDWKQQGVFGRVRRSLMR